MFCWLIGHKWSGGFDPYFEQCQRCSVVRSKQFKGSVPCPFCSKPINPPARIANWDYKGGYVYNNSEKITCPHCDKKIRFDRADMNANWDDPILIIDFKME